MSPAESVKSKAAGLGFDICGIAKYRRLSEGIQRLDDWCLSGMNAKMGYLCRDIDKRMDPEFLLPGVKSVIVTGLSYYSEKGQRKPGVPVISRYAYGRSYQDVIKQKLTVLADHICNLLPGAAWKIYSDTGPVAEKRWAVEAGLGWQGRHSIVINREIGSFFFIGVILLDRELDYDAPFEGNHCGNCRKCIEACPTSAINDNFTIDARKCISNLTIEDRDPVEKEFISKLGGRIYACDRCQEVCPWNYGIKEHTHPEFAISDELADMDRHDWEELSAEKFRKLFKGTPVGRMKYDKFRTNLDNILKHG